MRFGIYCIAETTDKPQRKTFAGKEYAMSVNDTDYTSLINQNKLNYATGLLGNSNNTNIAGISGNLLQQWAMLGSNSAAYRKLLQAQELGTVKQESHYTELLSDKYFNDNYDTKTGKYTNNTYKPDPATTATLDTKKTAGENLDAMRRIALAALNNPDSLNSTHYDLFEKMRASIAGGMVKTGAGSEGTTVTVEEATPATITKNVGDFHLLTDDQNFTISGAKGEKNYSFKNGDALHSIVTAINADSETTGVKAELTKGDDGQYTLALKSTDTGKASTAKLYQNSGDLFGAAGTSLSANGTDALTQKAETVATGDQTIAAVAAGVYSGKMFGDQTFTIGGAKGSKQYSFADGASVEDVVSAINANAGATGVMAEVIYNMAGQAEGIGIMADKAGAGQYVQITQDKGDLFGAAGKTSKVDGSGTAESGSSGGPGITSLSDLGKVTIDNVTYSFADLAPGGSAALAKSPDAALAVLDQAIKDIYEGRAQIKGFDPEDYPILGQKDNKAASVGNTLEIGNFGSDAITQWLSGYTKEPTS